MTKDSVINSFVCEDKSWLKAATICTTLCAMMLLTKEHSGALINPAMSISQFIFGEARGIEQEGLWSTYMLCPILGGVLAGFYSWGHRWMLVNFVEEEEAPKK